MDQQSINRRINNIIKLRKELRNIIDQETRLIEKEKKELGLDNVEGTKPKGIITKKDIDYKCKEVEVKPMTKEDKDKYIKEKNEKTDKSFFENIKNRLDSIPESNGSRYYAKLNVNIGIIADEFLYNSFKDIANFIYITPKNYKENVNKIDFLFIASTWNGLNKEWCGVATSNSKVRNILFEVIKAYKDKGIKSVFYSKEDPINYDVYIDIAKKCDYIFTTERDVVDNYKTDCKNENVDVMSFGINPVYHNPIGIKINKKIDDVLFSGSWYEKYPDRNKETQMIFDGVLEGQSNLKIIDRNFALDNERYFFPKKYLSSISPAIDHNNLQKVHKLYNWAINLNTIKYSTTMFANRIYELQALGNIILSNYSIGVNNMFPNVFLINHKEEVKDILNGFTEEEIYRHQVNGIRRVMSSETSYNRIEKLCEIVGVKNSKVERKVAVIVDEITPNIKNMFETQTYKNKKLITKDKFTDKVMKEYDIIAFFNKKYKYGMYYLESMVNAFKYTDCNYVTKDSYYDRDKRIEGNDHNYINKIKDKYKTIFWSKSYTREFLLSIDGEINLENGYSTDPFDLNVNSNYVIKKDKNDYKLSIIIATYNNGDHLLNKCFNSLRRSSMFKNMEIIIVDDGSTDKYTQDVVKYINDLYSNVKIYCYNDGGSGSASRPRNKGFDMSSTKYITYLDPDNEACLDGYTTLYKELDNSDLDLVIGGMVKQDTSFMNFNFHNVMLTYNKKKDILIGDKKKFISDSKFYVMSIQALLFKRELIENNNLKMIEGVFGEDTIFFQELVLCANKVKAIDKYIHIYYAAVEGSSVNAISKKFYDRYLVLEKLRIEKYNQYGLMDEYLKTRFDFYVTKWYFDKLKKVDRSEAVESIKILEQILSMYAEFTKFDNEEINEFYTLCKNKEYNKIVIDYIDKYALN